MVAAVRVHKHGGPEALTYEDVQVAAPGPGQARVKNRACGLNFIDTYFRSGLYPPAGGLPFISGNEGAGEVVAVGPGVTDVKAGDRVGYTSALGSYAAERIMPASQPLADRGRARLLPGRVARWRLARRPRRPRQGRQEDPRARLLLPRLAELRRRQRSGHGSAQPGVRRARGTGGRRPARVLPLARHPREPAVLRHVRPAGVGRERVPAPAPLVQHRHALERDRRVQPALRAARERGERNLPLRAAARELRAVPAREPARHLPAERAVGAPGRPRVPHPREFLRRGHVQPRVLAVRRGSRGSVLSRSGWTRPSRSTATRATRGPTSSP